MFLKEYMTIEVMTMYKLVGACLVFMLVASIVDFFLQKIDYGKLAIKVKTILRR